MRREASVKRLDLGKTIDTVGINSGAWKGLRALPRASASVTTLRQLRDHLIGGALTAIALDRAQGIVVPLLAVGQAGVGHLGDQISEIAGIADRRLNALIGDETADDQLLHAEVAQQVVDVGGDEHAGG